MTDDNATAAEISEFWFSPRMRAHWFRADAELDDELRDRFGATYAAAARGELSYWGETAQGSLGLVIVLDQLPRNLFRGDVRCYATDTAAVAVAEQAIRCGHHHSLSGEQQAFLYLPYMHSESLTDQETGVRLFRDAGLSDNLRWAEHHRDLIRRYGRFPHRNRILGRASTDEELEYLRSDSAFGA